MTLIISATNPKSKQVDLAQPSMSQMTPSWSKMHAQFPWFIMRKSSVQNKKVLRANSKTFYFLNQSYMLRGRYEFCGEINYFLIVKLFILISFTFSFKGKQICYMALKKVSHGQWNKPIGLCKIRQAHINWGYWHIRVSNLLISMYGHLEDFRNQLSVTTKVLSVG